MKFETPTALYNPKDSLVEWRYGGISYFLKPKEIKVFEGPVVEMAIKYVSTGLEVYDPEIHKGAKEANDLEGLPWKKLVAMGSKEGVFKPGMSKEALLEELKNLNG